MDFGAEKYVSFTTYRKSGEAVAAPVWIAPYNGKLAFTTESTSGKAKRLRNNPKITVRPCDARGRVADGAPTATGTAVLVTGAEHDAVWKVVRRKYWILGPAIATWSAIKRPFSKNKTADTAVIVTLDF
jgi:uncharacterized protein